MGMKVRIRFGESDLHLWAHFFENSGTFFLQTNLLDSPSYSYSSGLT